MKIGLVPSNPRDYEGNNCTYLDETAKIGIPPKYLSKYWTVFTKFSVLVDIFMDIIKLT